MFGKFTKTPKSTATDLYVQNMLVAVLGELSGTPAHLTQCKLGYYVQVVGTDNVRRTMSDVGPNRPFANRITWIHFDAYYALTNMVSRWNGVHGKPPALPYARGQVVLTNSAPDDIDWDLYKIEVEVCNGDGNFLSGRRDLIFSSEADYKFKCGGLFCSLASQDLLNLSALLRLWTPRKVKS